MFGFSLGKLLILVVIIGGVWYGFKLMGRLNEARNGRGPGRVGGRRKKVRARVDADSQEMVECDVCGAYVAAVGATSCDRADCPY
jgi:uncharacterized protein